MWKGFRIVIKWEHGNHMMAGEGTGAVKMNYVHGDTLCSGVQENGFAIVDEVVDNVGVITVAGTSGSKTVLSS